MSDEKRITALTEQDAVYETSYIAIDDETTGRGTKKYNLAKLIKMNLSPLDRHLFRALAKNVVVNTGTNTRNADVIYNHIFSQGSDRSGTTYRGVVMTSDTPVILGSATASGTAFNKSYFKNLILPSNSNLYIKLDEFSEMVGSTTYQAQLCVASYDSNGEVYYKVWQSAPFSYRQIVIKLDPRIVTWGNIMIWWQFRNPKVTLDCNMSVFASTVYSGGEYESVMELEDTGKTVVDDLTT